MGSFADELLDRLRPLGVTDDLTLFASAIGDRFQPLVDIVRDAPDGTPGWAVVMSVDTAPMTWLGWIAQFRGVTLDPSLDDASQRIRIKKTDGFNRGSPGSVIGAAQQYLTGNRTVILRERWDPTAAGGSGAVNAWHYQVLTYTDETPDPAKTLAALIEQKPGGDIAHHEITIGQDYQHIRDTLATYAAIPATYATYEAIREGH